MNKELSQIEFYFPEGDFNNKEEITNSIISLMKEKGSTDYSGYADLDLLKQGILGHIGNGDTSKYKKISDDKKKEIEDIISNTIDKCNEKLSVPTKNFIFVHPYLPTKEDEVFNGVMAVAVYSCVFHLFIDPEQATEKTIENTVAHELNHTIYYYRHYDDFGNYTLLDEILLEGLAENFREQYFDPEITKWAGALDKDDALTIVMNLQKEMLETNDQNKIKDFLFGNDEYQKWTGYSVGYWLVKEFINKNPNLSWDQIMETERNKFLEIID